MSITLTILAAACTVGAVDVLYYHLYRFRLYALGGQLILWGGIGLLLGPWAEKALVRAGRPVVVREAVPA